MALEMKTKAEIAAIVARRLGISTSQVVVHEHPNAPWSVTVIGAVTPVSAMQRRADDLATALHGQYGLKD